MSGVCFSNDWVKNHDDRPSVASTDRPTPDRSCEVSDGMYRKLGEVASRREVYDLQMELRKLKDRWEARADRFGLKKPALELSGK